MKKNYYTKLEISPLNYESIEQKKLIHNFEDKNIHINMDKINEKYKLNELR